MRLKALAFSTLGAVAACALYVWPYQSNVRMNAAIVTSQEGAPVISTPSQDASPTEESPRRTDQFTSALAASPGITRRQALERAGYDLALSSVEQSFSQLSKVADPADRAAILRGIFSAAAEFDAQEAINLLKTIKEPRHEYELAMRTLAENWRGGQSFSEPGYFVPPDRPLGLPAELGRWLAWARPDAAEAWANDLLKEYPTGRAAVLASAASYLLIQGDSSRAQSMTNKMTADEKSEFLQQLGMIFERASINGWERVKHLPPGELRTIAAAGSCRTLGAVSDHVARQIYGELPWDAGRSDSIAALAEGWWKRDQKGAAAWASSLSGDDRIAAEAALERRMASAQP